jgi:alkylation response protein AidB-like acyl-CoA dehydrogenase
LTDELARALIDSGLFGLLVPGEFGGMEVDPATYIDVIEELSYADGSTGWVVLATTYAIATAAAWLPQRGVEAIFNSDEGYIIAGQLAPTGTARRVPEGYRVSGRFQFASGSQLASWMFGAFVLLENGKPVPSAKGKPQSIWCYAPRRRFKLISDSWDVVGLAATDSVDYTIDDELVRDDFVLDQQKNPRRGGPAFEIGVSIAHVAWALGVALRALDEVKMIAARKRRPGRASLIDQPAFQHDFAEQCASLESARALVHRNFAAWYEAAERGSPSLEAKAGGRLAGCWGTKVAAEVVRFAYLAAGSARNSPANRLQRAFRDMHVGATHKHVDDNVLTDVGTVLLGVNEPGLEL